MGILFKGLRLPALALVSLGLLPNDACAQLLWSRVGLPGVEISGVHYDPVSSSILAGSLHGIHRSTDGGATWTLVQEQEEIISFWDFTTDGHNNIYGANSYLSFARSTDGGATWRLNRNDATMQRFSVLKSIGVDREGRIFVGTTPRVYRSSDSGSTWVNKSNGLPPGVPDVQALVQNPLGSFFAASGGIAGAHIYRTTDAGDQWLLVREGTLENNIQSMVATPRGVVLAYAEGEGVFRSVDDGATWTTVSVGVPEGTRVMGMALAPDRVYLYSMAPAVYESTDDGASWSPMTSSGLPEGLIWDLTVQPGVALYAATDSGVYRAALTPAAVPGTSDGVAGLRAWPVPASEVLNVAADGVSRFELVDPLGRVVATANGPRGRFDLHGLPDGAYTVKAHADGSVGITRAVVAR